MLESSSHLKTNVHFSSRWLEDFNQCVVSDDADACLGMLPAFFTVLALALTCIAAVNRGKELDRMPWPHDSPLVVVTGSNRGIGYQTVRRIARTLQHCYPSGSPAVVLTARAESDGLAALARLREEGLSCVVFRQLDVTDPASVAAFAKWLGHLGCSRGGGQGCIDALVNNAGVGANHSKGKDGAQSLKEACVGVNYRGTRDVIRALRPLFKPRCRVVSVSSSVGQLTASAGGCPLSANNTGGFGEPLQEKLQEGLSACQLDALAEEYLREGEVAGPTAVKAKDEDEAEADLDGAGLPAEWGGPTPSHSAAAAAAAAAGAAGGGAAGGAAAAAAGAGAGGGGATATTAEQGEHTGQWPASPYAVSKTLLTQLTRALHAEEQQHGRSALLSKSKKAMALLGEQPCAHFYVAVCPGLCRTEMLDGPSADCSFLRRLASRCSFAVVKQLVGQSAEAGAGAAAWMVLELPESRLEEFNGRFVRQREVQPF
jgi:NAD(P)-dependent dehydrogenase (short-subunit alcohol dehydrogenase family)